ncbi:MAG: porin [Verrucomicrobiota bacterium]
MKAPIHAVLVLWLTIVSSTAGTGKEPLLDAADGQANDDFEWCHWLQDNPGQLYRNKKHPWIQSFQIEGRLHYQFAHVDGTDVNGLDFNDSYDDFRRLRLGAKTDFLRLFTAEVTVNLVDDNRYRRGLERSMNLGRTTFDEVSLEFDVGDAIGDGFLDEIKLKAGRMRVRVTEEAHMSSREIYTIERSAISTKLGGEASRPTGVTLELGKGDWELTLGAFSAEPDAPFISDWQDGSFYYGSLEWEPTDELRFVMDYTLNDANNFVSPFVDSDALGYSWGSALSAVYERERWGFILEAIYGDNGGGFTTPLPRRQGDFHGFVVMPWYWIIEDKLQLVFQYQYASSEESQGLQLPSRYIRGNRENPAVDVDNGRGNEHHYFYGGLNYLLCGDNVKLMAGISYDDLTTRTSTVDALTYSMAFRMYF